MAIRHYDQWKRWKTRRDRKARAELIRSFVPLVHYVARRMTLNRQITFDIDDMTAAGMLGLISAVDRFDPERGMEFTTFAVPRIRGAILDEIRNADWVPRNVRDSAKQLTSLIGTTSAGAGPVDLKKMAQAARLPERRILKMLKDARPPMFRSLSQDGTDGEDLSVETIGDSRAVDPAHGAEQREMCRLIPKALGSLPPIQRNVIMQYYFRHVQQKAIAGKSGVSRSRISQIHSEALQRLREALGGIEGTRPAA